MQALNQLELDALNRYYLIDHYFAYQIKYDDMIYDIYNDQLAAGSAPTQDSLLKEVEIVIKGFMPYTTHMTTKVHAPHSFYPAYATDLAKYIIKLNFKNLP